MQTEQDSTTAQDRMQGIPCRSVLHIQAHLACDSAKHNKQACLAVYKAWKQGADEQVRHQLWCRLAHQADGCLVTVRTTTSTFAVQPVCVAPTSGWYAGTRTGRFSLLS